MKEFLKTIEDSCIKASKYIGKIKSDVHADPSLLYYIFFQDWGDDPSQYPIIINGRRSEKISTIVVAYNSTDSAVVIVDGELGYVIHHPTAEFWQDIQFPPSVARPDQMHHWMKYRGDEPSRFDSELHGAWC
ncbi:MAG: hypothetical protein E6R03_10305 [Hyphomicrobiaceae bacterium]|nr:MAG: hypothetical protein E6R03_10305 [Hyphomicrobiaceae bacterium]